MNRGRIQFQGKDYNTDLSFPWATIRNITKLRGYRGIRILQCSSNKAQLNLRIRAIAKAKQFIDKGPHEGMICISFQDNNLPTKFHDARVDIEIISGLAFT